MLISRARSPQRVVGTVSTIRAPPTRWPTRHQLLPLLRTTISSANRWQQEPHWETSLPSALWGLHSFLPPVVALLLDLGRVLLFLPSNSSGCSLLSARYRSGTFLGSSGEPGQSSLGRWSQGGQRVRWESESGRRTSRKGGHCPGHHCGQRLACPGTSEERAGGHPAALPPPSPPLRAPLGQGCSQGNRAAPLWTMLIGAKGLLLPWGTGERGVSLGGDFQGSRFLCFGGRAGIIQRISFVYQLCQLSASR